MHMGRRVAMALAGTLALAGCGGSSSSWMPWSKTPSDTGGPRTPAGATAYGCDNSKRLLVRYEAGGKSAWVIYPDREFRLDRTESGSGERFSRGSTTLATKEGEAMLMEGGT